ncbi:MAG TPA: hypothetical protein H9976_08680 [Candidatus Akkermansia intestinavium]|nr:hypothetical protein [Candidatus Akkermansia intestinavium]
MKRKTEKRYPFIWASVVAVASFAADYLSPPCFDISLNGPLVEGGLTVGSIFAGFDAVHTNTLLTTRSRILEEVRRTKLKYDLVQYLESALSTSLYFIIISILLLMMPDTVLKNPITTAVWAFFATWMIATYHRIHSISSIIRSNADS